MEPTPGARISARGSGGLREDVNRIESRPMPIPETTSAEAFERYVGGKCLVACRGEAWRDIKA